MKIMLDLSKSMNNFEYADKDDLYGYLKLMLKQLNDLYDKIEAIDDVSDDEKNRLYDILDMFTSYTIIDDMEK